MSEGSDLALPPPLYIPTYVCTNPLQQHPRNDVTLQDDVTPRGDVTPAGAAITYTSFPAFIRPICASCHDLTRSWSSTPKSERERERDDLMRRQKRKSGTRKQGRQLSPPPPCPDQLYQVATGNQRCHSGVKAIEFFFNIFHLYRIIHQNFQEIAIDMHNVLSNIRVE